MSQNNIIRYMGGYIRKTANGTYSSDLSYNGKRYRSRLKTLPLAKDWIVTTLAGAQRSIRPLTATEVHDAGAALDVLPPGITLRDAAQYWADNHASGDSITFAAALARFVSDRASANFRPRTEEDIRQRLDRFGRAFGGKALYSIRTADIAAWLTAEKLIGRTRNHYRANLHTFFEWAIRQGFVSKNPASAILPVKVDSKSIEYLSVSDTQSLLRAAIELDAATIPYLVIGLFAGLRPGELKRLQSSDVGDTIVIGPTVAKMRRQRHVTILPNLRAWLETYPPSGAIAIESLQPKIMRIRTAAQIPWPHDAMRHSFATYHCAMFRDAPRTAHELGHTSPDVLYNHYRGLATQEDAAAYFAITPESLSKV